MIVGVLRETEPGERRVALVPDGVKVLVKAGLDVRVEAGAGAAASFADAEYEAAGAKDAVSLIVAKGQGHNYWEGFFRCPELIEFAIARARSGAAVP